MNFMKSKEVTSDIEYKYSAENEYEDNSFEKAEMDDQVPEISKRNVTPGFDKLEEDSWDNIKTYDEPNRLQQDNANNSDSDDDVRHADIPKPSFKREVSIIQADGIQYIVPVVAKASKLPPINPVLLTDKTYPDLRDPNQREYKNTILAPLEGRVKTDQNTSSAQLIGQVSDQFTVVEQQAPQGPRNAKSWAKDNKPIIIGIIIGLAILCIAILAALIATTTRAPTKTPVTSAMKTPVTLNTTTTTTSTTTIKQQTDMFVISKTILGDSSDIVSVIKLANGNIASCALNTIKIWSLSTYASETLVGHIGLVNAIVQLIDGKLASVSQDSIIKIWDIDTSSEIASFTGHTAKISTVNQLSDGRLVTGAWDKFIKVWNLTSNTAVATLSGHRSYISCLIQLQNGNLASGSWDNVIKIWTLNTWANIATLSGHTGKVLSLAQLTDGKLVSGSLDTTLRIWDLNANTSFRLTGHSSDVTSVIQLNDGLLASGSADKTIKFWNSTSKTLLGSIVGDTKNVLSLTQLTNGNLISSSYKYIKIWNKNYS